MIDNREIRTPMDLEWYRQEQIFYGKPHDADEAEAAPKLVSDDPNQLTFESLWEAPR